MYIKSSSTQLATQPLLLIAILSSQLSAVLAQGNLTPPGPPAPTMKSLAQIEPRTPISSGPATISEPGSYYLTTNITVAGDDAITIAASGVTLDLSGFTIASTAPVATGIGVAINHNLINIDIRNGSIQGGATNNGSGVFDGPGFRAGIIYYGWSPNNVKVSGVKVSGCSQYGIFFDSSSTSTMVESCTVRSIGGRGITASTIKDCIALDCSGNALEGRCVFNSQGESVGSGHGVHASFVAQNCFGSGNSGNGINALGIANGCFGNSTAGIGVFAANAISCVGYRQGGTAIQSTAANGCLAQFGANNIIYKYNTP